MANRSALRSLHLWLLDSSSPVKFRPAAHLGQFLSVLSLLLTCNTRRSRATTECLLSLADFNRRALSDITESDSLDFIHRRNGKIVFYSTRSSLKGAIRKHRRRP